MLFLGSRDNLLNRVTRTGVVALPSVKGVIIASILFVATPVTVSADGIVTLFAGRSFEGKLSERVATYGVSLANMAGGIFGFEVDGSQTARSETDSLFDTQTKVTAVNGNVILGIPIGAVRPYVVGGLGWFRMDNASQLQTVRHDGLGTAMGVGVMGFLSNQFGARVDLRYNRAIAVGNKVLDVKLESFKYARFTAGLVLRF
tara:strand:+ start:698 stop:1303 length:606 start_codon:yes stop_codon:yes gene_type:complete